MRAFLGLENLHFKAEKERKYIGKESKSGKGRRKEFNAKILQVMQEAKMV